MEHFGEKMGNNMKDFDHNKFSEFVQNGIQMFQSGAFNGGQPQTNNDHGDWKAKKATLINKPFNTLVGKPGQVIFAEIEVKNNMNWPWKPHASLQSDFTPNVANLLDEVAIPIDFPVSENSTFKLSIPMKIKEAANISDQEFEASFTFVGRKGNNFGDKIVVKFKVQNEVDEIHFYQTAMELYEKQDKKSKEIAFDIIVKILKYTNGDKEKAEQLIALKKIEGDDKMKI